MQGQYTQLGDEQPRGKALQMDSKLDKWRVAVDRQQYDAIRALSQ